MAKEKVKCGVYVTKDGEFQMLAESNGVLVDIRCYDSGIFSSPTYEAKLLVEEIDFLYKFAHGKK